MSKKKTGKRRLGKEGRKKNVPPNPRLREKVYLGETELLV